MKNIKYLLFFLVFTLVGCEGYFGEDANVDPDEPIAVTPSVMLPQIQARLAYTYAGDFSRFLSVNTGHILGVSRQFAVIGAYGIVPGDVDNAWSNIYSGTLNSNREMYNYAIDKGFNHYAGVALALECYAMMIATDVWGDIPYSDAFKFGEKGVYQPEFDSQEDIYKTIFTKLEEARTLLEGDDGGNAIGSDDLIYGGDASLWGKFCNVLEARGQLHLSKKEGAAYSSVIAALNKGSFADASEEASVPFGAGATENSPWYQYIDQRDDLEVGSYYVSLMESLNDPRVETYGFEHAVPDHPIFTGDQPVQLLSFTEQEFIRAEALLNTDKTAAYDAYLSGIRASFNEAEVKEDTVEVYIAQSNIGVGSDNLSLENIITQKYIALLASPEVFNDWRRTNFPAIPIVTGSEIPRRFPYPETEEFSNDNTPSPTDVTIFSRVWWDE